MRNLLLVATITISLHSVMSFGQKTEYNKNVIFGTEKVIDQWFYYQGSEVLTYAQTPVGYAKSFREIEGILSFYGIRFDGDILNKTVFDSSIKMINDYEQVNRSIIQEKTEISILWKRSNGKRIYWLCDKKSNSVIIER